MACPTCSNTMQLLSGGDGRSARRDWWCPRCGTLKTSTTVLVPDSHGGKSVADLREEVAAPMLVARCRSFRVLIADETPAVLEWNRLGIAESINTPANR